MNNDNNDNEGQYWWVIPLLGFIAMTLALMGAAGVAALP